MTQTHAAAPPPSSRHDISRIVPEAAWVVLAGCAGVCLIHRATLLSGLDLVQADIGDSRLIVFLLDHWRRVFAGTSGWSSPAMFYPLAGTLGYSDMLLGLGAPYAVFRRLGLGLFEAANATLVLLSLLSYLSAYWLLRRVIRASGPASAVGALFFAFAYPKLSQFAHFQLRFDFFQPLALGLIAPLWLEDRSYRRREIAVRANGFVALVCFGALTAFYNTWFFLFWLAGTGCAAALFPSLRARTVARWKEGWGVLWQPILLGAVLLIPFFSVYLPARQSGMGRGWESTILPSVSDYLRVGPHHLVWGWTSLPSKGIEARLGAGLAVTLVVLAGWGWSLRQAAGALIRRRGEGRADLARDLLASGLLSGLAITFSTIQWGPFAPWAVVYRLVPGASAMLAVGRWVLTLALPTCILLSVLLDRGWRWGARRRPGAAGLAALGLLGIVEQAGRIDDRYSSSVAAWYHRNVAAAIPDSCEAFLLAPVGAMVSRGQFDSARYLAANPDVANTWRGTAWDYYRKFGLLEGRRAFLLPPTEDGSIRRETFDDAKYLAANPDVASNWRGTPWEHYRQFGFREGRVLDPEEAADRQWPNFHYQLSALIASAISGKPTVNGASGLQPIGYPLSNVLDANVEGALAAWLRAHPGKRACLVKKAIPPQDLVRERVP